MRERPPVHGCGCPQEQDHRAAELFGGAARHRASRFLPCELEPIGAADEQQQNSTTDNRSPRSGYGRFQ
jgi:hypothetical protein